MSLSPALLEILACPEDKGPLFYIESESLLYNPRLMRRYDVRDDIPVMLIPESTTVDQAEQTWRGPVGVVTSLIGRSSFDPDTAVAYVCGPEVMMRFTIQELERKGLTDDRLYVSMERNMKCGIGLCGHCQLGRFFICKDGPVMTCAQMSGSCWIREV